MLKKSYQKPEVIDKQMAELDSTFEHVGLMFNSESDSHSHWMTNLSAETENIDRDL